MTDDEFWVLLREKQRRYRRPPMPRGSVARRRFNRSLEPFVCAALMRLDGIEYEAWHRSTEEIPLWLKNELKHVEEGREVGRCPGGIPNETPFLPDILFHGVLGDEPWWEGNTVLPSNFIMKKTSAKDGRARN